MGKRLSDQAGKFREHEIEKQEIRWRFFQGAQAGAAVLSRADLKALVSEIVADQFDDIAVVFDNKDTFHAV